MPSPISIGTRDVPLKLARIISQKVNEEWESGSLLGKVSLITQDLLKFWFQEPHIQNRNFNFHEGQKQAILNIIYLHEVLGIKTTQDIYEQIVFELLAEIDSVELKKPKYEIPKYAVKMATGTGKTWVMHALLIWQYLNAKNEIEPTGRFTKNFLLVAPGLIVYERLLDAYLGKEDEGTNQRVFEKSDLRQFQDLFLPFQYRDEVFGFVQSAVAKKEEIGSKITGDGLIAIANWHLFMEKEEEGGEVVNNDAALDNPQEVIKDILPVRPGISGGNALEALDANYLSGKEIDFLAGLPNLFVMNDEAHHIHENMVYGEIKEVEWQKSLNKIANGKGERFIQIDFSATPYDVTGSGQKRVKHYFPHIVVDFDLKTAIRAGLVKTIAIDKRKEIVDLPLDYSAIRENNEPIALSDGQKLMLRAGLSKLKILEQNFVDFTKDTNGASEKYPKMLIMCEDTKVTPLVVNFFIEEGLAEEEVIRVDSNKKGEIPEAEWKELKQKLFNIDKRKNPKVIVSVLMLREGFDVNNICVIVPLRASTAPILIEQTIGRGLRLMWREPEYKEIKQENIRRLLGEKKEPKNYLDLLLIVEHPSFMQFYDDLLKDGLLGEIDQNPVDRKEVLGDIIKVGLKENYQPYDLYWPVIIKESDEELVEGDFGIEKLDSFTVYDLESLQKFFKKEGEEFVSEEITVKTRFGDYIVNASLFNAQSYNEYLGKIIDVIVNRMARIGNKRSKVFPVMQINESELAKIIDIYIRNKLFGKQFDPFIDNNWKVLLLRNGIVTQHIIKEIGKVILEMQNNVEVDEAKVEKRSFSEVAELRMRENYSLEITKTIYERLSYPSNKGDFEKNFLIYADADSQVEAIMKVNENYHNFAYVIYIRTDGFLATYRPDFIVKTKNKVYLIETKAEDEVSNANVQQKRLAILDWLGRINKLELQDRLEKEWEYILLGESHFYGLSKNNASIDEICELAKVNRVNVSGKLL
ncbi:MAG: DEAD/DEAH box helicase family protein [bacterium]|nr:DEAD/DEAH box helicase family protein [bacterium]